MNRTKGIARIGQNEQPRTVVIWTAGHSNKDICTFISLLQTVNIQTVVDCRSRPRSRWPHFNAEKLAMHLASMRIDYELRGHNMGGLSGNVNFDETLDEMKERAKMGERIALICSEGKPEQCHRGTILAPALEKLGVKVEHLRYETKEAKNGQISIDW